MRKEYKVAKHNSTVCGYPGRDFDWSKFDWDSQTEYDFGNARYSTESEFVPDELRGQFIGVRKAPEVYTDDGLIEPDCEYLHVPYAWAENATVYRVRPNESMRAGKVYRGRLIKEQKAVKKEDGWYWVLEF